MRVLALVTDAFGGHGGIAQYNRDFITALSACDRVSHVEVLPRLTVAAVGGLPPKVEQKKAVQSRLKYSLAAIRAAASGQHDVVFCGHLYMAPLGLLAARRAKAQLIVQLHGREAWPPPSRSQRSAMEAADLVLAVSRYTRSAILASCRIEPEQAVVLPNTVRSLFSPGDASAFRSARGLEGKPMLLTVGRLDPVDSYKGHDRIIRLLPKLRSKIPELVYVIAGDGEDRQRLAGLAEELHVHEAVHFLGAVGLDMLQEAYRAADLFVMPSTQEGFGIVYLEAMASGTPALGLDVGGAPDSLVDGELGVMCSEEQLEAAIVSALRAPVLKGPELALRTVERFGPSAFQAAVERQVGRFA